jgi:hypothetical protein
MTPQAPDHSALEARALRAYFLHPHADIPEQPTAALTEVCEHDGRTYVVLSNLRGPLAAYAVRSNGLLMRVPDECLDALFDALAMAHAA